MTAALDIDRAKAALVIGVTGHRDIREEDREHLKNSVRGVLRKLRREYRSTPFILLSPLAEGADRLVAEVALLHEIGARLIVPLPMPMDMYEKDFNPDSLKEFHGLLAQADRWFEIPLVADAATVSRQGPERDLQYEAVGKYIVHECQILLALWDGVKPEKVGGTAAIVQFQTEGLPEEQECNLLPPELFPVYHILTPRVSNPNPEGKHAPFQLRAIYPPAFASGEDAKNYYERTFGNLDEFNRQAAKGGAALEKEAAKSKTWIIDDADERNLSQSEAWTLNRFAVADALAIQFRKKMLYTHRALHWLVFLSFSSFVFYAHWYDHSIAALGLALAFLAMGYVLHKIAKEMAFDEKRQDYRALAEGCRVEFFWLLARVRDSVPDNYLGKQRTELDWIRIGLRGWRLGLDHHPPAAWNNPTERLHFALKYWVADQRKYFKGAVKKSEEKPEFMERFVTVCLSLAITIGVLLFASTTIFSLAESKGAREPIWMVAAIIAIELLLAGAALLHHANGRMAHSEHLKRYNRMLNIFDNAFKSIQGLLDLGHVAAAKSCLRELGKEVLVENGDRVLLHRERPLEIPHP